MNKVACFLIMCLGVLCQDLFSFAADGDEALHVQIDRLIEAKAGGPVNPTADDAEFLRRIFLDFTGRIPTADEAREFLNDSSADKRPRLIDRLLAGDEYPKRMRELFDVMLMERRGENDEWTKYLQTAFEQNKPWDQMVREMLNPDAESEANRGSAFFITKRLEKYGQNPTDYPGLVRDVGRMFLGMDVQCAQCHDHLFVDDYKQVYYQGLYGFLGTAFIRRDLQFPAVGEKLLSEKIDFMSVFEMEPMATGPKLPAGEEIAIPVFKKGEEYEIAPDRKKRTPGKPKFSPLAKLAEHLPRPENDAFKHNIANRLWWIMMGRGLVEPLDMHHSDNPPSHPELLKLLANEFAEHNFDMKWLLRELALTKTYQRSSLLPADTEAPAPRSYRVAMERPLIAEQLFDSILVASGTRNRLTTDDGKPDDKKLAELRQRFRKALANAPKEPKLDFSPSVKSALFLSNDEVVLSWLEANDGNLVDCLVKMQDDQQAADQLYLAVLTRSPTEEESKETLMYLSKNKDRRPIAFRNLAWALVTSTEFCINH